MAHQEGARSRTVKFDSLSWAQEQRVRFRQATGVENWKSGELIFSDGRRKGVWHELAAWPWGRGVLCRTPACSSREGGITQCPL
jgi:hypothetical protein